MLPSNIFSSGDICMFWRWQHCLVWKLVHSSLVRLGVSSSTDLQAPPAGILDHYVDAVLHSGGFFQHQTQLLSKYSFVLWHSLMRHDKHVGTHQKHYCDPIYCSHPGWRNLGYQGGKTAETEWIYSCFAFNHLIEKVFQIYFWTQYTI